MLAWSEELITSVRKPEIARLLDVIVGGKLFTVVTPITLANITLNPKLKSAGAGRCQLLSRWWDAPTASSLAWKTSLRKVRTLWHCSRLKSVALYMIDRGDIRQAIDRCSNIWASLPEALAEFMVSSSIRLTAWLQNSKKRAERSERLICGQSHRDYLTLWLSASSSACHGLLIITVITPLPTKPARQKCQRTESWQHGNYWHADASAWCCCARCKIHEGVSWC